MALRKGTASLVETFLSQRATDSLRCCCSTSSKHVHTTSVVRQRQLPSEQEGEVAAIDPFLAKLQNETEDELRQLLARRVQAEEDKAIEEEEEEERRSKERGEWGGPRGAEPTRYGDWEKAGRCSDF